MRRFRFKAEPTGVRTELGNLEQAVMEALWTCGECPAAQVHQQVSQKHQVALTTVVTTLERLRRKGIVERTGTRRSYRYRAKYQRDQLERRIVAEALAHLERHFPEALATYFCRVPEQASPDTIRQWVEEIRKQELEGS